MNAVKLLKKYIMINNTIMSVLESIRVKRSLAESTLGYYGRTLTKLMKDTGYESIEEMLSNPKILLKHIECKKVPYQHNLVCIMIVATSCHYPDMSHTLNILRIRQAQLKSTISEKPVNDKSDKEKENWTTYENLIKCCKVREKNANFIIKRSKETGEPLRIDDIFEIQKWIICGLYVGDIENPPLRLDFINMTINYNNAFLYDDDAAIGPMATLKANNNLYIQSSRTKYFYLNEYKTQKKYGPKTIKLTPYLNRMINIWIKVREQVKIGTEMIGGNNLLFSKSLRPFTESTCCVYLTEAFKPCGKKMTVNLIRHIFISDVTQKMCYEDKKRISSKMCHNIDMQIQYIKNDL